jgi:hypothetical protein
MMVEAIRYDEVARAKNLSREGRMSDNDEAGALCPYIQKPFEQCYCTSTSSLYAEATIYYCGGNYKDCEIYAKNAASEGGNI